MSTYIKHNNQYYILSSSSLADDRIMVMKHGDAFGVFDRFGDIHPIGSGSQGVYYKNTRFLSRSELLIENKRPLLLSSSLKEENDILTVDLTNPDFDKDHGKNLVIEKGNVHIHRSKFLWKGTCYEKIRLANFGTEPISFVLAMIFDADYADIFEVRGMQRKAKGRFLPVEALDKKLILGYEGLDMKVRSTVIEFCRYPKYIGENKVAFDVCLLPKAEETLELQISFEIGERRTDILSINEAYGEIVGYLNTRKEQDCFIHSSNEQFNEWLSRSRSDMLTMVSDTDHGPYPYAGVPWYSCPFGRDGIITAMECLWMDPDMAKGVLNFCAKTQAKEENAFQDAEPGKIFHEIRGGEMAELGEVPFKLYYGTIDATPLFIVLAGMYLQRTDDLDFIRDLWPNIEAALYWIDNYGDIDKDGFVEYRKKSEIGLLNQGWKDSHDSIMYEDGQMAEGSIALCEVQGYVFDAKLKASEIAEALGYTEKAEELKQQAKVLQDKFMDQFWDDELNTFVLALDGNKRPCRVKSSNAGHCLLSGIVPQEKAEVLVNEMMSDKMFSGWGIRTLASDEVRYNPMSYHNGSIWPHDNALVAYGFRQYGFSDQFQKVFKGMFDLSQFVEDERIPELYCGFGRRRNEGPTAYPVACSPQAWAVGSVFFMVQASLGLRINGKDKIVQFFQPSLPAFLNEITITNLKIKGAKIALQVRRSESGSVEVYVLQKDGDIKIEISEEPVLTEKVPL